MMKTLLIIVMVWAVAGTAAFVWQRQTFVATRSSLTATRLELNETAEALNILRADHDATQRLFVECINERTRLSGVDAALSAEKTRYRVLAESFDEVEAKCREAIAALDKQAEELKEWADRVATVALRKAKTATRPPSSIRTQLRPASQKVLVKRLPTTDEITSATAAYLSNSWTTLARSDNAGQLTLPENLNAEDYKRHLLARAIIRFGWNLDDAALVAEGLVWQGMTHEQLLWAVGEPDHIDETATPGRVVQLWKYVPRGKDGLTYDAVFTIENKVVATWVFE